MSHISDQGFFFFFFFISVQTFKRKTNAFPQLGTEQWFQSCSKCVLLVLHGAQNNHWGQRGNVSVSFPTPQREKEACLECYTHPKAGYTGVSRCI